MHTQLLRQQHQDIGAAISALAKMGGTATGAEVRARLLALSGKVTTHLAAEDRMLYPTMRSSGRPGMAALADQAVQDIGGLGAAFKTFLHAWSDPAHIEHDRAAFVKELHSIAQAVTARVTLEERQIYPQVDAL
jgi:hypothetical protein